MRLVSPLTIPGDQRAEAEVVGVAVATPTGYRLAAALVDPQDFWVPRHGKAFAACAELTDVEPTWDAENRIQAVNALTPVDVDVDELRRLVNDRSRFHDVHAEFAALVAGEARRRRAMIAFADAYNAVGRGATLEEAIALVADAGGITLRMAA